MKRNLVISTKVTPEEKAEFTMIAQKNGISTSEWVYSILLMNKNGYEKVGKKRMDRIKPTIKSKVTYNYPRKKEI